MGLLQEARAARRLPQGCHGAAGGGGGLLGVQMVAKLTGIHGISETIF